MVIEFRSSVTDTVVYAVDQVSRITEINDYGVTYIGYAYISQTVPINPGEYIVVRPC